MRFASLSRRRSASSWVKLSWFFGTFVMAPTYEQEQEFILHLGKALTKWQSVEASAYGLFCFFMKGADKKLISIVFHQINSFDSKITLLDRCAYFAIQNESLSLRWTRKKGEEQEKGLKKRLQTQTRIRNRIVHFSYRTGMHDGIPIVELGPSFMDATYAIKDKWKKPDLKIDLSALRKAQDDFKSLSDDIHAFEGDLAAISK